MFLSSITITNINKQLKDLILRSDAIEVKAISRIQSGTFVRYTMDGQDMVSVIHPKPGDRLSDLIADAVRWQDYMLMEEIYSGQECVEEVDDILRIWPVTDGSNVKQLTPGVTKTEQANMDIALGKLADKFNHFGKAATGGKRK